MTYTLYLKILLLPLVFIYLLKAQHPILKYYVHELDSSWWQRGKCVMHRVALTRERYFLTVLLCSARRGTKIQLVAAQVDQRQQWWPCVDTFSARPSASLVPASDM